MIEVARLASAARMALTALLSWMLYLLAPPWPK